MKRILYFSSLIIFSFILTTGKVLAGHMIGGEITYKHVGNLKYEVTYKFYRDCRGVPFSSPTVEIMGLGGSLSTASKKTLSVSLVSINDVSNFCKKQGNPCDPPNQTISGSDPAVEEHTYVGYLDFNNADSSFKKHCIIMIGAGQCCRDGYSTTFNPGDFWVYSELNLCEAPNNSSPVLSSKPNNVLCCNQPFFYNLGAIDMADRDSLSFAFTDPLTSWTGKVKWNTGKSAMTPFTDYYPSGYNKSKGPDPTVIPPIGTYFDPVNGNLIVTPVDCGEVTITAIKITEWRKDSSGKYIRIGSVTRDMQFMVITCPDNNPPTLKYPYKFNTCAGQKLCFDIKSDDKRFSAKTPLDSVSIEWNHGISNATFGIKDTTARLPEGRFCWSTSKSDASNLPYNFHVTVRDNVCPMNGLGIYEYAVHVKENAEITWTKTFIKNGLFDLKLTPKKGFKGTAKYWVQLFDSAMNSADSLYYFYSKGYSRTVKAHDSLQFYKGGTYILSIYVNNDNNCPTQYFDTIKVEAVKPFLHVAPNFTFEKTVCKGSLDTIFPIVKNAYGPVKYIWSTSKNDSLNSLKIKIVRDTTIGLDVYDSAGYHRVVFWKYKLFKEPVLSVFNDTMVCVGDTAILGAKVSNYNGSVIWNWKINEQTISSISNPKVTKAGTYTISVSDSSGCNILKDSIVVSHWIIKAVAGKDLIECIYNTITVKGNGLDTSSGRKGSYSWYKETKESTPVSTKQNYEFTVQKDGQLILELFQTDGILNCRDWDTVSYFVRELPLVQMMDKAVCQNELSLDLHQIILKPTNSRLGKLNWTVLKTLQKPDGKLNQLEDLVQDRDTSELNSFYLNFGKSIIDLGNKLADTLKLSLGYTDELGCSSTNVANSMILVKKNVEVNFDQLFLNRCFGDSITSLSKDYGVQLSGGAWYTNNRDSSTFNLWPQGDLVMLNEKVRTDTLNSKGGKYLISYHIQNNACNSYNSVALNLFAHPQIIWNQIEKGDSIIITEFSTYTEKRVWYINDKKYSDRNFIVIAKSSVKKDLIKLRVNNTSCSSDSIIEPKITWGIKAKPSDFISISPNPAYNNLLIKSNLTPPLELKITNQLGQTIFTQMLIKTEESIDISKWSKGIYFIEVKANENVGRVKFVKE